MTIENAVQNSVKITGLDTTQAQMSDMFPADWGITVFQANGNLNSTHALSNNGQAMEEHALVYEHDGAVYLYKPTAESIKSHSDLSFDDNVDALLKDDDGREKARWITKDAFLFLLRNHHLATQVDKVAVAKSAEAYQLSWNRASLAVGAGAGIYTFANGFGPLSGRYLTSALGLTVAPVLTGLLTGMILNYYLQVDKFRRNNNGEVPTGKDLENIKKESREVSFEMGAAIFGATGFGVIFEHSGLSNAIKESMGGWTGTTINGMPLEFQIGMMIASGVGLALFLTGAVAAVDYKNGKSQDYAKLASVFTIGLLVGIAGMAASMFTTYGMKQTDAPNAVAKLMGAFADTAAVTALFMLIPSLAKKYEKVGTAANSASKSVKTAVGSLSMPSMPKFAFTRAAPGAGTMTEALLDTNADADPRPSQAMSDLANSGAADADDAASASADDDALSSRRASSASRNGSR